MAMLVHCDSGGQESITRLPPSPATENHVPHDSDTSSQPAAPGSHCDICLADLSTGTRVPFGATAPEGRSFKAYISRHRAKFKKKREYTAIELMYSQRSRASRRGELPQGSDWLPLNDLDCKVKHTQSALEQQKLRTASQRHRKRVEARRHSFVQTPACLRCAVKGMPCSLGLPGHRQDEKCSRCLRNGEEWCLHQTVDLVAVKAEERSWSVSPFAPSDANDMDPKPAVFVRSHVAKGDFLSVQQTLEGAVRNLLGMEALAMLHSEPVAQEDVAAWALPPWHHNKMLEHEPLFDSTAKRWREHLWKQRTTAEERWRGKNSTVKFEEFKQLLRVQHQTKVEVLARTENVYEQSWGFEGQE